MTIDARTAVAAASTSPDAQLALDAVGIRKVYGPTIALAGANLQVRAGEIHGLLGENGAGKSTLVRILAGVDEPDAGSLQFFGEPAGKGMAGRRRNGLAFIHQDLGLFDEFSVAENIALASGFQRRGGLIDHTMTEQHATEVTQSIGFDVDVRRPVGELPLAEQTLVALCRALSEGARLVVLDEPTAYLEARQARSVFALLSRLREQGVACILVTHRSEDILRVCDRVTVLRDGKEVAVREANALSEAELVHLITGRTDAVAPKTDDDAPSTSADRGTARLTVDKLLGAGFGPVSLEVRQGEIVGICGLADAGQFALAEAISGDVPAIQGTLCIDGAAYQPRSVGDALRNGLGVVPANRARDGLAGTMSAAENLFMNPSGGWFRRIRRASEAEESRERLSAFRVRPADPDRLVATFSGGNQQKILLAKWLSGDHRLVILNEPSAGVDVGAKADIQSEIRDSCRERQTAALVISTDFREIADLCDRAIIMRHGRIVGELAGGRLRVDTLTELAYGGEL
jgi:ribose transport system ATP-binding protein